MPNKTHNDNPSNICQLDRQAWSKRIVDQIKDFEPPKVIGIHGTWGTGKTSLLRQMYHELGGTDFLDEDTKPEKVDVVKVVWFEAWQYQHEPNILAALLKEIRDQLSLTTKIWDKAKEAASVGTISLMQSISATFENYGAFFGGGKTTSRGFVSNLMQNADEYQRINRTVPLDSVTLKKQLQLGIDQLLYGTFSDFNKKKNGFKKAVIFIDDLDRCEPDTAFRILESIKVYLNLNNCVFVLGMDVKALDDIIAKYYKKELGADKHVVRNRARLYLEKICQDIYALPTPNAQQRNGYFKFLLNDRFTEEETAQVGQLLQLVEQYEFLPPFPRSIKILANVLISHLSIKEIFDFALASERNMQTFLIVTYLYAYHIEIYTLIYSYPTFYNQSFLEHCKNPPRMFKPKIRAEKENEKNESEEEDVHPELKHIVVYKKAEQKTAEEIMRGISKTEEMADKNRRMYPSEHLRQVLWISEMILKRDIIDFADLQKLQLK